MKKKIIGALIGLAVIPLCILFSVLYAYTGIPSDIAAVLGLVTVICGALAYAEVG